METTITIDPRIVWTTLTEALQAWGIASRSTIVWAYWHDNVMMRKSGAIWLVYVPDMVKHFGNPKQSLVIPD